MIKNLNGVSVEALPEKSYLLRGHADGGVYGDEICWTAVVTISGKDAHIKGLNGKFSLASSKTIEDWLLSEGVTRAGWERRRGEKTITVEVTA